MTAPTSPASVALPNAAASTERPELTAGKRSTPPTGPAQPSPRKLLDAALLQWPIKLRRPSEEESPAEARAKETAPQARQTDVADPVAVEPALATSEPDLLLAQAAGGSATAAPIDAPADAAPTKPAAGPTSIESKLLTPLTQNASWASASWFGAAPTGAAGTGALLAAAALVGGGGGGGSGSAASNTPAPTPADTRAPVLQSAEISNVGGTQLVLTYDENLSSTLPAASAFQVLVDGSSTSVSSVARGSDLKTVVLTLGSPVTSPRTVKVSLGDGSQVRDGSGNVAATFRDQAVTVTDKTEPSLISQTAVTNATSSVIVLRYSEDLRVSGRPVVGQFQVKVDNVTQTVSAVDVLSDSIRLTLASKITATSPTVRLSYALPTDTSLAVQDAAGNRAVALDAAGGITVSHSLDVDVRPTVSTASNAVAAVDRSARQIRLTFTEALQAGSLPDPSSLMVDVSSGGNTRSVPVSSLKLAGSVLELTLAEAINDAQAGLRVRYSPPLSGATLKDWAGNTVAAFDRSVATVDAVAPTLVSSRFTSSTQLELTFDETLGAKPAESAWSLSANGGTVLKPTSSSVSGSRLTLNFDTAIRTGTAATLSYTAPANDPTVLNLALQDSTGNDSASFSRAPDTTAPRLLSATTSANGLQILLNYDEALLGPNSSGTPVIPAVSTGAFKAFRGALEVSVSSVSISGTQVQLTLASAVLPNENVSVFYTAPTASIGVNNAAIQDTSGNDADPLGSGVNGQAVTNAALPAVTQLLLDSQAAALDRVVISLNVAAVDPLPAASAFTVKVGGSVQNISRISRSGQDLVLELSAPITSAGALLVSYTQPSSTANPLKDANGKLMASFSDQSFGQLITGTTGADTLVGQAGRVDYFLGSAGADSLEGRGAADHFVWPDFGSGGPGGLTQTIKDFGFKRGSGSLQGSLEADLLDLSQLLDGYTSSSTLADFVRAVKGTGDKLNIEIDHNGKTDNSGAFTKTATLVLDNVTINTSNQLLVNSQFISHTSGNLVLLADVITHLMNEGQLAVL